MLSSGWTKKKYTGRLWDELASIVDAWISSDKVKDHISTYTFKKPDSSLDDFEKHYIVRFLPHNREIITLDENDKFLEFAVQPEIVSFITSCMNGHQPVLQYYDLWHTFPLEPGRPRVGSQSWHKDAEAFGGSARVVKVFLYFQDCLEMGAGPFEMVTNTGQLTFFMKRGEILIADTGSFTHRGGYSTTLPRTFGVWVYNDSEKIVSKPRYNLTPKAKEKFASPVLFEYTDWLALDKPILTKEHWIKFQQKK